MDNNPFKKGDLAIPAKTRILRIPLEVGKVYTILAVDHHLVTITDRQGNRSTTTHGLSMPQRSRLH
jgi:hypothetical protein